MAASKQLMTELCRTVSYDEFQKEIVQIATSAHSIGSDEWCNETTNWFKAWVAMCKDQANKITEEMK